MFTTDRLSEPDIYRVLSNPRRRATIRHLGRGRTGDAVPLGELAAAVAATEAGADPVPSRLRDSVYASLHQTHLPILEELGVLRYDQATRTVHRAERARDLDPYMDVVTGAGLTWEGLYRSVGTLSLLGVVGSAAAVPGVAALDPLVWGTVGLGAVALTSLYQLWTQRRSIAGLLFG